MPQLSRLSCKSASRRADISRLPGSSLLRPVKLLAPCADLTSFVAAEAFTSRLSTSRSPFSPLDMTTAVSGRFCRWDLHPLERQLVSLHHNKEGGSIKKRRSERAT